MLISLENSDPPMPTLIATFLMIVDDVTVCPELAQNVYSYIVAGMIYILPVVRVEQRKETWVEIFKCCCIRLCLYKNNLQRVEVGQMGRYGTYY